MPDELTVNVVSAVREQMKAITIEMFHKIDKNSLSNSRSLSLSFLSFSFRGQ
jgi:hypothetical protein